MSKRNTNSLFGRVPLVVFIVLAMPLVSACSSARAYRGPVLPSEKLARIYFEAGKGVSLTRLSIDGHKVDTSGRGVDILPGSHEAAAEFEFEENVCEAAGTCVLRDLSGMCRASLRATAARAYAFRVFPHDGSIAVQVADYDTQEEIGQGNCSLFSQGVTLRAK